jgi:glucokinase-like ROK family protein
MKKNTITLKEINKKNILKIIIDNSPISRIDISRLLNISRPTISAYITELIEEGFIKEIGKSNSSPSGGKKAVLLQFNNRSGYILGVMIGVKTIRIGISDLRSNILKLIKIPTEEWQGPQSVINKIVEGTQKLLTMMDINKSNIIGVGIGVPGLVDSKFGLVIFSPNLTGWENIKLQEILGNKFELPVFIENECRVQAIAEKRFGIAKNKKDFVCFETGVGIGTGVFINNELLLGKNGIAGEVGHIITDLGGKKLCHCGNVGCLETLCSIGSLIDDIQEDIKSGEKSMIKPGDSLDISDVYKYYNLGDDVVVSNVMKNADYLGIGISNAIKMFNPELVILHGTAIEFGEKYLDRIKMIVAKNTFPKVKDEYNIQYSKLGENVGLIGATSIVFDKIFNLDNLNIAEEYMVKKY